MISQTCTLYLVRHGETQWNIDKRIQGHTDIPLTEKGENQAHELRKKLQSVHFSKVYSSDLIRAKRTAEILNIERSLALQTTQALRERNFGSYQGKLMAEGKKILWELLEHYGNHPHLKETGVETNEQMMGRTLTFLREVSIVHPDETILIVCHGGIMRRLLLHLGYKTENELIGGAIQNLAYIKIICDGVDFFVKETFGILFNKK